MAGNIGQSLHDKMQEVPNTICYSLFVNLGMGESYLSMSRAHYCWEGERAWHKDVLLTWKEL